MTEVDGRGGLITQEASLNYRDAISGESRQRRVITGAFREAYAAALAAPAMSILTIVIIAGMCAAVILTSGRTVAAEGAVISSIDSVGTRSIVVRAAADSGFDTAVLERMQNIEGIEWTAGFGRAQDVQNAAFPGGARVPLRQAFSDDWGPFDLGSARLANDVAYGSNIAVEQLGLLEPVGQMAVPDGTAWTFGGTVSTPEHLEFLEPLLVVPQATPTPAAPIGILVVVAERPDLVASISATLPSLLGLADPTSATIETSEKLADLRAVVQGQLGQFSRNLTAVIFGVTAPLTAALLFGTVFLRRRDFGRRRALGASQRFIAGFLIVQTAMLAAVGSTLGTAVALSILAASGDPLPDWLYIVGLDVLGVIVAITAAIVPAIVAARRDPLVELRVA